MDTERFEDFAALRQREYACDWMECVYHAEMIDEKSETGYNLMEITYWLPDKKGMFKMKGEDLYDAVCNAIIKEGFEWEKE